MLDALTKESFLPRLNQPFRLTSMEPPIELRLIEVEARWGKGPTREPFSLVFAGPATPVLPQSIYRLENDEMGALEIFLVPIGRDAGSTRYEAAFN
jgi:hypothetical protein